MRKAQRFGLVVLILVLCTGCDRATKRLARESLAASPPVSIWHDLIRLEYTENTGAFLGLGSSLPEGVRLLLFVALPLVGLLLSLALIARVHSTRVGSLIGASLLAGGGVGNLIDRVLNDGAVVDFVRIGSGWARTGVFNLADVAIMAGFVALLLSGVAEVREARGAA
jgi:signal peptidase II